MQVLTPQYSKRKSSPLPLQQRAGQSTQSSPQAKATFFAPQSACSRRPKDNCSVCAILTTMQEQVIEQQQQPHPYKHHKHLFGLAAYDGGRRFEVVSICCSSDRGHCRSLLRKRSRKKIPPASASASSNLMYNNHDNDRCVFPEGVLRWSFLTFMLVYHINAGTHRFVQQPPLPGSKEWRLSMRPLASRGRLMFCRSTWLRFQIWAREEDDDDVSEHRWELKQRFEELTRRYPPMVANLPIMRKMKNGMVRKFPDVFADMLKPYFGDKRVHPVAIVEELHCLYLGTTIGKTLSYHLEEKTLKEVFDVPREGGFPLSFLPVKSDALKTPLESLM